MAGRDHYPPTENLIDPAKPTITCPCGKHWSGRRDYAFKRYQDHYAEQCTPVPAAAVGKVK